MAQIDMFVGKDTYGNVLTDTRPFKGDSRYTARSEDVARQFDWNMMEYQNWWNSPAQQVSRLQDAGLNPLFYLGGNAGTTPAAAGGNQTGHSMTSANGSLEQALEASRAVSDSLLNTQKQALDYEIARRQQDIDLKRVGLEERQTAVQEKQLGLNAEKTKQEIEESRSRVSVNNATIEQIGKQNEWTDQQIAQSKAQEAVLKKQVDEVVANIENLKSQTNLNNVSASRIRQMIPLELENLAATTNLTYHQASVEVEKMFNFCMDTNKKSVEIDIGRRQKVLIERQADGQLQTNLILAADADWRDAEHEMQVVTGYWQAVNGSINAVGNTINAASNFYGPKAGFYRGAAQRGIFQNTTNNYNPYGFNNYSTAPAYGAYWSDSTPVP